MRKMVALVLVLCFILVIKAQTNEFPIATGPSNQTRPVIYGNIVVWQDDNGIYGYDLSSKSDFQIAECECSSPAIYENIVVWIVESMNENYPNYGIWSYNVSTRQKSHVMSALVTTEGAYQQSMTIYENTMTIYENIIVWIGFNIFDKSINIYGYDLSARKEFQITDIASDRNSLAIYGNIVVWEDNRNGNWDIYGYDLSTKREFQITTNPSDQHFPAIYGDIVIWLDSRENENNIFGYNLSSKEEFRIISKNYLEAKYPKYPTSPPAIFGNIVIWYSTAYVFGYNLSTNEDFKISTNGTAGGGIVGPPAIYKNTVVWTDWRDRNNLDIYGTYISGVSTSRQAGKLHPLLLLLIPLVYLISKHTRKLTQKKGR